MNKLQVALQDCLELMQSRQLDLDGCLAHYPDLREDLEPLLRASQQVERLAALEPTAEFKQHTRLALQAHMHAYPRRPKSGLLSTFSTARLRLAASALVLAMLFVTTGTVLAQTALPGQVLYDWKLRSENVWASYANVPQETALITIAERRAYELIAVRGAAELEDRVLNNYIDVLEKIISTVEANPDIDPQVYESLSRQQREFQGSGINIPVLEDAVKRLPLNNNDGEAENSASPSNEDSNKDGSQPEGGSNTIGAILATALPSLLITAIPGLLED